MHKSFVSNVQASPLTQNSESEVSLFGTSLFGISGLFFGMGTVRNFFGMSLFGVSLFDARLVARRARARSLGKISLLSDSRTQTIT